MKDKNEVVRLKYQEISKRRIAKKKFCKKIRSSKAQEHLNLVSFINVLFAGKRQKNIWNEVVMVETSYYLKY